MNATLLASLLALSFVAPGALAQDQAVKIDSFDVKVGSPSNLHAVNSWQSLTGQALVHKSVRSGWAGVRWRFASFHIADNHGVRVARVGLPVFMSSSNCNLCRPHGAPAPTAAVVLQALWNSVDGPDTGWRRVYGKMGATVQLAIGTGEMSPASSVDAQRRKTWL